MSYTVPTFDEILNGILTDYANQFPGVDVSKGTLVYVRAAAHASAIWGLYNHQQWLARQIFPDTADTENLEHHGWVRGITKTAGETKVAYLTRLLDYIRRPPAGGNKYDYVKWALECDNVSAAYPVPLGQGLGTIDLVILADAAATGSEIPDNDLLAAVRAYIVDINPTHVKSLRVLPPTIITQAITMTLTGSGANAATTAAEVTAYLQAFTPGQGLYLTQLSALALANGANDALISIPAANVPVTGYQMIRPGVVNVT